MRTKISTTITFEFDRPEQTSIPTKMLEEIAYSSQPLSLSQKEALFKLVPPAPKPVVFFEGQKVTLKPQDTIHDGYSFSKSYKRKDHKDQIFVIRSIWSDEGYDSPRKVRVTIYPTDNEALTRTYKGPANNLIDLLEPVEELFGEILQKISPAAPVTETDWITWNPFSYATPPEPPDEKHAFLLRRRDGTILDYNPEEEELILDDNECSLWMPRNFPHKDIVEYKIVKADNG